MSDLHINYRIGLSTISNIVREVCESLWATFKKSCFPTITEELLAKVATEFEERANFSHVIGAIDGKHIRVIKPEGSASMNFNYKHFFSILLLAACDSNYKFLYVDVGAPGKSSASTTFKNSTLYKLLKTNKIKLPPLKTLSDKGSDKIPYFLIGDEGFGLCQFLLRPFGGKYLSVGKKVFNYRLTRARRYIECSFGILSNKWRILHRAFNVEESLVENIIKSCCLLHNFVRDRDNFTFEDRISLLVG
ncbi:protein ANTAGONIST OF LIKE HETEROCHROMATIN PROTEIN 1-like [Melanaphis sacchari]|uniref:protein ANTAGONIST OF LIKE HETEROCHROMATIN PROTEIN 1-like n=1 Tax=Melanaphis sacchari TaxID=742174 RepID=UPI000DC14255|nr:protein ANTAGONIST OF LIKE HETEROCHROMATIN PROTEIN 1-like [Melanaphis sacchari]